MEKKLKIIFEILFVVGAIFYYYQRIFIPEYRAKMGSSDYFVRSEDYSNMVEISIDNHSDFVFVWNDEEVIYHMFFLSKDSSCLYNKNIEGKSFEEAISLSILLLDENHYLNSESLIKIIRYGNKSYSKFLESLTTSLHQYGIDNIVEEEETLENKCKELGLGENSKKTMLLAIDLYSKEKVRS